MVDDQDWLKGARECMDLHFKLADEFNPLMANLYSDDALIQNNQKMYPTPISLSISAMIGLNSHLNTLLVL